MSSDRTEIDYAYRNELPVSPPVFPGLNFVFVPYFATRVRRQRTKLRHCEQSTLGESIEHFVITKEQIDRRARGFNPAYGPEAAWR
jgi:hypothetical protein